MINQAPAGIDPDRGFIGAIGNGDWAEYWIESPAAGIYPISFALTSPVSTGSIEMFNGTKKIGAISVPLTGGWHNWTNVETTIVLVAGKQTVRFNFINDASDFMNFDSFRINFTK